MKSSVVLLLLSLFFFVLAAVVRSWPCIPDPNLELTTLATILAGCNQPSVLLLLSRDFVPSWIWTGKLLIAFVLVLLYLGNIPKVAKKLSAKLAKKRSTADKSATELHLDMMLSAIAQEKKRRRETPHDSTVVDNNGLTPFAQAILMCLGGAISYATDSMFILPSLMLLDEQLKYKALRYVLCTTLGMNGIYTIDEEMLDAREKIAEEKVDDSKTPVPE